VYGSLHRVVATETQQLPLDEEVRIRSRKLTRAIPGIVILDTFKPSHATRTPVVGIHVFSMVCLVGSEG
jgi:hypothetical protein